MTPADVAAYIGAAAWLPQITAWVYKWLLKPTLTVVSEGKAEVGHTSLGPILNIKFALSAERQDIIINDFRVQLVHQDGDTHTFRWSGMREDLSETRDASNVKQGYMVKDQLPIALKIGTSALVEKTMRFQEPRFSESHDSIVEALVEHFNFLKGKDPDYVNSILKSKEYWAVADFRSKSIWWKEGRYDLTLQPATTKKVNVQRQRYSFVLSRINIDRLRENSTILNTDLENTIKSNLPGFQMPMLQWNWVYPELTLTE